MVLLASLVVAAVAASGLIRLDAEVQRNLRIARLLEGCLALVHQQRAVEWQAIAQRAAGPAIAAQSWRIRDALDERVRRAESAGFPGESAERIKAAQRGFYGELDNQFRLLRRGALQAALEHDKQEVGPSLDEVDAALRQAASASRRDADRTAYTAKLESLALLLCGVILIALLSRRQARLSHRAQLADRERGALRRSEERFRGLVEHSSDTITLLDGEGRVRLQNRVIADLLGVEPAQVIGAPLRTLVHPEDRLRLPALLARGARDSVKLEWRLRHADGHFVHVETVVSHLPETLEEAGIVLTTRDVTQRKALEEQLRHRAFHDPLTQLPNRALFFDRAGQALSRDDAGRLVAILFVDLDDFKLVNDRLGHAAGDELLLGVAKRLRGSVRSADTAARLGGDEFGVLLEGVTGVGEAVQAAQRILAALDQPFTLHGDPVLVRPSVGVAVGAVGGAEAEELMSQADVAMYAAKANGKHRYELYDADAAREVPQERTDEADRVTWFMRSDAQREEVLSALEHPDGVIALFQPIVDLATGLVAGYEALARFPHGPKRPPNAWFAQAHRCGLGPQLELKAARAALAAPWRPEGAYLSINLSPFYVALCEVEAALPEEHTGSVN